MELRSGGVFQSDFQILDAGSVQTGCSGMPHRAGRGARGAEAEGEEDSPLNREPNAGLDPRTPRPEGRCLTN